MNTQAIDYITKNQEYLYGYCKRLCRDSIKAEDLLQSVTLKFMKSEDVLLDYPKTYVCQAIKNRFINNKNTKSINIFNRYEEYNDQVLTNTEENTLDLEIERIMAIASAICTPAELEAIAHISQHDSPKGHPSKSFESIKSSYRNAIHRIKRGVYESNNNLPISGKPAWLRIGSGKYQKRVYQVPK